MMLAVCSRFIFSFLLGSNTGQLYQFPRLGADTWYEKAAKSCGPEVFSKAAVILFMIIIIMLFLRQIV